MFDFDANEILAKHDAEVTWWDTVVDNEGNESESPIPGWGLSWKDGAIYIGPCKEVKAREAAAIFIILWKKDVSAQMAAHLAVCYAFIDAYADEIGHLRNTLNDVRTELINWQSELENAHNMVAIKREDDSKDCCSGPDDCENCHNYS